MRNRALNPKQNDKQEVISMYVLVFGSKNKSKCHMHKEELKTGLSVDRETIIYYKEVKLAN
ncbi:hypothetical protein Bca4012_046790 [Brassica carinata]|uniref:(rape) hypothetical protein n=1 Tax=Brassica napus TaxID=3708 RepID=A0A816J325_BRANA|nr:unnamed protein product [Brassica napus]